MSVNDIIIKKLEKLYPDAKPGLNFSNPFELLIATILSAQCTDKQVNKVTPVLFERYNTPEKIAKLKNEELQPIIKSCGFYKHKSKNIISSCNTLVEEYNGQVPSDFDKLTKLAGVGRKTANVVVSNAFGIPAIAVDTHVFRVSNRLGLADAKNVDICEEQLKKAIPKEKWSVAHHLLIWHGRRICDARKPKCEECILNEECKYYINIKNDME